MNKNNYVLVIDGNNYLMDDKYDNDYKFNYNLGFVMPKDKLEKFNKQIYSLVQSLYKKFTPKTSLSQIFNTLSKNKNYDFIFEIENELYKIGNENEVKVFRSSDHKTLLEKSNEKTQEMLDYIAVNNVLNVFHASCEYFAKKYKDDEASPEFILCDENIKKYAEQAELSAVAHVDYFKPEEFSLTLFTGLLCELNNITLDSANKKIYNAEDFSDADNELIDAWKNYGFKLYYDKYERVRDAATQITNFIIQDSNYTEGFDGDDDDDDIEF